jgi:hypothetical protein
MNCAFGKLWDARIAIERFIHRQLLRGGIDLANVLPQPLLPTVRKIMAESGMLLNGFEAAQVLSLVSATVAKLEGSLAEVGVYRGGSAKLICLMKGTRDLHLFDTFEGLPPPTIGDHSVFRRSQFRADLHAVQSYLRGFNNVHFYKGLFPGTAADVSDERFCFVHLDVDLYEATKAGIEFFYPRLVPKGVLMSHDYNAAGVRRAFDEFFRDKPEIIIQQPAGSHCLIVKASS